MLGQGGSPLGGVFAGELAKVGEGITHSVTVTLADNSRLSESVPVPVHPEMSVELVGHDGIENVAANGLHVTLDAATATRTLSSQ